MTPEQAQQVIDMLEQLVSINNYIYGLVGAIFGGLVVLVFFVAKGDLNT